LTSWSNIGGSLLGTNRTIPSTDEEFQKIAESFRQYEIKGMLLIGGWEGYAAAVALNKNKEKYPEFNIPIVCVPATVSNNVPGTDVSIGSDTALNCIVESADKVKLSAVASRARVFIMEVMGGNCGYLGTCGSIAGGAQLCYTPEHGITLRELADDVDRMKKRFKMCKTTSLVINSEKASETYTTDILSKIFTEEGKGFFDVRHTILGHLQQGYSPSPMDRLRGAEFAQYAVDTLDEYFKSGKELFGAVGINEGNFELVPFADLVPNMDFKRRVPKKQRWEHLIPVVDLMRSRPQDDASYRPFSFHLKTVHPDKAPIPSMNDAAYHHHQSTSANLLANVSLDKLVQAKAVASNTTSSANDTIIPKPKDDSK
jgi:6-phosphofructokinase 1